MVNLDNYNFKHTNVKMWPFLEELFLDAYIKKCHESEPVRTANKRVHYVFRKFYDNLLVYPGIYYHARGLVFCNAKIPQF